MLALVTGGAASGKSELAEKIAAAVNTGKKAYLATMRVCDEECAARVARHKKMRAGKNFETVECPLDIPGSLYSGNYNTVLLECMSNFAANVIFLSNKSPKDAVVFIQEKINKLRLNVSNVIIVTNEVFSDSGDYDNYTRSYINALGTINQYAASMADIVIESVCGIPVFQKGKEELSAYENIF